MVSPDGVAPSRMVGVSASVSLPLHHKVHKFYSGTTSPRWSQKNGCGSCIKIAISVLTVCVYVCVYAAVYTARTWLCAQPIYGWLRGPVVERRSLCFRCPALGLQLMGNHLCG